MIDRRFAALGAAIALLMLSAIPVAAGSPRAPNNYTWHIYQSDQSGVGDNVDPNLVNGWGLTRSSTSPWWVANNGTATSTLYNGAGAALPLVVKVPGAPTGTVFNGGTGFAITDGVTTAAARFLFASEDGTISGWNPGVPATNPPVTSTQAFVGATHAKAHLQGPRDRLVERRRLPLRDRLPSRAGRCLRQQLQAPELEARLPRPASPEALRPVRDPGAERDDLRDLRPKQDKAREDEIAGTGKGFVSAFDPRGHFLGRIASRGALNAPWGLAWAPATGFGRFSGDLLVGNFGNGRINGYRWLNGHWKFDGTVRDANGKAIVVDGLWGIGFGNGAGGGTRRPRCTSPPARMTSRTARSARSGRRRDLSQGSWGNTRRATLRGWPALAVSGSQPNRHGPGADERPSSGHNSRA